MNFHLENEQLVFGTGNVVDGIALSDDKVLQGRRFSCGDTQRYRSGPSYQTLQANLPATGVLVASGQVDGPMAAFLEGDDADQDQRQPEHARRLTTATSPSASLTLPVEPGPVEQRPIDRTDDHAQAGERYRTLSDADRDDLVLNLVTLLGQAREDVQQRCVSMFGLWDADDGRRVGEGLAAA